MSEKKSNSKADEFRNEGNEHFKYREFLEALECYNKSLCFALPTSTQMSLAYANRSAVYVEKKFYQKCLDNIELALKHGYQKPEKLKERKEKCKNLMKTHVEDPYGNPWNFFKLSHPANEKLPFIVNCLELRENKKYGRYIITNSVLKTGDIIAIEEPIISSTHEDVQFRRCANCLKSNMLSLIPCDLSCVNTMYCSKDCKEEHESLHKFQCEYPFFHKLAIAAKMVIKAAKIAGSVVKLRGLVSDTTSRTVFDFDFSNSKDPIYNTNMLVAVNSLLTNEKNEERVNKDHFFMFEPFKSMATSREDRDFIFDFFYKLVAQIGSNQYGLNEHTRKIVPIGMNLIFDQLIGSGLFPFASLLNHSCDANVRRVTVDNKLCIYAARPITAGDQLFISYGFSSYRLPLDKRQNKMQTYNFICDCRACVSNYPEMNQLKRHDQKFVLPHFSSKTVLDAKTQFKKTCSFVDKNVKHHPCYDTMNMMEYNSHLLHEISKVRIDDLETDVLEALKKM